MVARRDRASTRFVHSTAATFLTKGPLTFKQDLVYILSMAGIITSNGTSQLGITAAGSQSWLPSISLKVFLLFGPFSHRSYGFCGSKSEGQTPRQAQSISCQFVDGIENVNPISLKMSQSP